MIPDVLSILCVVCFAVSAGLFAWYAAGIARQITYVTLADGRKQERKIPFTFRILLPLAPNLKGMMTGPGMQRPREKADAMLVTAGYEGLLAGWEFLALKLLVPLCFGPFMILGLHAATKASPKLGLYFPILCILFLMLLYLFPVTWLRSEVKKRQTQILRAMPFVLDLLTLSVEAGMDFMTAMQRTTERPVIDPLTEEFLRVVREIQVGTSRKNALLAMSRRIDLPDMKSFVNSLVQADELGVSLGAILRIQSEQIRTRRFERAEKLANEAPVKLLAPLMIFIFPAVFLILLGPVIYRLITQM